MKSGKELSIRGYCYELQIAIDAPRERAWRAIVDETNAWWLPDFHMVGEGSTVTLDTRAGGGLVERLPDGGSLLWMTVQWCRPEQFTLYLVGHTAPDWGGPSTSHLKLELSPRDDDGCTLKVVDAIVGRVDDATIESLESGWTQLFTDGLKAFAERDISRGA